MDAVLNNGLGGEGVESESQERRSPAPPLRRSRETRNGTNTQKAAYLLFYELTQFREVHNSW